MCSLNKKIYYLVLLFLLCLWQTTTYAQLGFCNGNSGDPVFFEDFGTAPSSATQHVSLPASQTLYTFVGSNPGPDDFSDGKYTVSNLNYQQWNWFNMPDHTEGDANGRMLLVNADYVPGKFYEILVTGLCENTTYEFSSWLLNLTPRDLLGAGSKPNPCNVRFEIWDSSDTSILKSGDTGDFLGSLSTEEAEWLQYAMVFKTEPGQTSVLLRMRTNGPGGYGNNLAIDDIVFKTCGDAITTEDSGNNSGVSICNYETYSGTIEAIPDGSVFGTTLFYQWQESVDGVTWIDIMGEVNQDLTVSGILAPMYYRAKVAEYAVNINNSQCNTFSDVFQIELATQPLAPVSNGNVDFNCTTNEALLSVTVPSGVRVDWYDSPTGGTLLESDNVNYTTSSTGTFYAESVNNIANCVSSTRTAVSTSIVIPAAPISNGDVDSSCTNNPTTISVTVPSGGTANWYDSLTGGLLLSSGSTLFTPSRPGDYYAESEFVSTGCRSMSRTLVTVGFIESPIVEDESILFCKGVSTELHANVINESSIGANYLWSTGDTGEFITVNTSGAYTVEVTNNGFCAEIKSIELIQIEIPVIETIKSDGRDIVVLTGNMGDFLYSLDGITFQLSNRFKNVEGGLYTVYVKGKDCSNVVSMDYLHFYIPKFFTPNNDGRNDTFDLKGIEYYSSSEVFIFDRYGKLLKNSSNAPFSWNGTFKGTLLPSSDYWYVILIDNQKFTGHVALKR